MLRIYLIIIFYFFNAGLAIGSEVVTEEDMYKYLGGKDFRRSHKIMQRNRKNVNSMLDSFFVGDYDGIKRSAIKINDKIQKAEKYLPVREVGKANDGWSEISNIYTQSNNISLAVEAKDFTAAYNAMVVMDYSCIKCHQAVRKWGVLEMPEPGEAGEKESETEKAE